MANSYGQFTLWVSVAHSEAGPWQAERAQAGGELEPGGQGQQGEVTNRGDTAGRVEKRFLC